MSGCVPRRSLRSRAPDHITHHTSHQTHHRKHHTSHHNTHTRTPPATRVVLLLYLYLHCVSVAVSGGGGGPSLGAALVCARAAGLTEKQRGMCRTSPAAVAAIGDGLKMAYAECRWQMSGRRWNCSGVGDSHHFGHVMPLATREAAFTYAITSAGVTHALNAACARGDLPACHCTVKRRRGTSASEQFKYGGCGEGAYGARISRRFLDDREMENDARALMNLHNNHVGRKVAQELFRDQCKCHGVSGSCAVQTCWRTMPQFRQVAAALRDKYDRAKQATLRAGKLMVVRRHKHAPVTVRPLRKVELAYLEVSPSYCEADAAAGSLGTHHRHCNRTSRGEDGCESMCCGRGYSTVRRVLETKCRCRFHWCCRVTCDTCVARTESHICN